MIIFPTKKNIWQNSYMLDLRICPLLAVFLVGMCTPEMGEKCPMFAGKMPMQDDFNPFC